jgi:hypothetical protein
MPPPIQRGTPRPSSPVYPAESTELAWRTLVAMFRAYAPLRSATIKAWDGDASDLDPPSDDGGPWIRLTPSPMPSSWSNHSGGNPDRPVYDMGFTVAIELSTPGTAITDSMRLWGQVMNVLHPPAPADLDAQEATFQAVGIESIEIKLPAWGLPFAPAGKPTSPEMIRTYGIGHLDVVMHFGT